MLIGNSGGILRYNGNNWQFIETPAKSIVRALAKDKTGQIFVGASDDLGYLSADKSGKLQFISLVSQLPEQYWKFGDMYKVFATSEGVYFQTQQYIFRWHNHQLQFGRQKLRLPELFSTTTGSIYSNYRKAYSL